MTQAPKHILINAFNMNCVGHINHGLWTHPRDRSQDYTDIAYWTDLARLLERGKFDVAFAVAAVLMLIVSAIVWAIAAANGNHAIASKGRTGVLVALGAAVLAGGGVAWMNWLIALGDQL